MKTNFWPPISDIVNYCIVGASSGELSTSMEQEKYFSAIVAATPMGNQKYATMTDSLTSLDSLMLGADSLTLPETPNTARKNPLARAVSGLRTSGGKSKCKHALSFRATPLAGGTRPLLIGGFFLLICYSYDFFRHFIIMRFVVLFDRDDFYCIFEFRQDQGWQNHQFPLSGNKSINYD